MWIRSVAIIEGQSKIYPAPLEHCSAFSHLKTRVATLSKVCSDCPYGFVSTATRILSICCGPVCRLSPQSGCTKGADRAIGANQYGRRSRSECKESKMFKRILVAYDESPESGRALLTGIDLAKSLNAQRSAVSVHHHLPPHAANLDPPFPRRPPLLLPPPFRQ